MSSLPFGMLPAYRPRRFLAPTVDLGNWEQVAPYFDQLQARAQEGRTVPELENWLRDGGEPSAVWNKKAEKRQLASTCDTKDPGLEGDYIELGKQLGARANPRHFELERAYLTHPLR